jgi:hypothetical protein
MGVAMRGDVSKAQGGWWQPPLEAVLSPGQMEGTGLRGKAGTLREQGGDGVRGTGLGGTGVLHGPSDRLLAVEGTHGDAVSSMLGRGEATRFEREGRGFSPGRERQKPPEELVIAGLLALLQQRWRRIGSFAIAVAVVPAAMAGATLVPLGEAAPGGRGGERQGVAREVGWDGRAVGLQGKATRAGGAALRHGGASEGRQRERGERGCCVGPQVGGVVPGCAVPPDMGHGLQPLRGGRSQDAAVGEVEPGEAMFFHRPPTVFPAALFMPLAHVARHKTTAVVRGKLSRLGLESRGVAPGTLAPGGCEVVDHDWVGHGATGCQGVLVAGEAVFHGLRDGARDRHHAAVAQDHDKEAQAAGGVPDPDRAEGAPIDLGARAGGKRQCEPGGLALGSDGGPGGFDQGGAARKALLA